MMRIHLILAIILNLNFSILSLQAFDNKPANVDSLITALNEKAYQNFREGRFDESIKLLEDLLELRVNYAPDKVNNIIANYNNLIISTTNIWDFDKALDYSYSAMNLITAYDSSSIHIGRILQSLLLTYTSINDLEKASQFIKAYHNFYDKNKYEKDDFVLTEEAMILWKLKNYSQAIKILLDLPKTSANQYYIYNQLALIYIEAGDITEANRYYQMIFTLPDIDEQMMYRVYQNYGLFMYEQKHNRDSALYFYNLALENVMEFHWQDKSLIAQIYQNYGELHLKEQEILESLNYLQKALKVISPDIDETDYMHNPIPGSVVDLNRFYRIYKLKAQALYAYYLQTGDKQFLSSSLEVSHMCFDIIHKIRYRISSEGSQFSIAEGEKDVYSFAIRTAYQLYELSGEQKYLDQAFRINEMGRAFVLLSHLRGLRAMEFGKIPQDLIMKEKELNRKLSFYEEQIMAERQDKQPDEEKIKTWEEFLLGFNLEYDRLLREFERNYPEYYNLKYRAEYIDPAGIRRKISRNEAVVEYAIVDSSLYTFIITKDHTKFYRHEVGEKLIQQCNDFYSLITTQNFSKDVRETYKEYCTQGYNLYRLLLEPFEEDIRDKSLIIVADGEISYLPFDALLTEEVDFEDFNYNTLPYLLLKNPVGFSYSSTMHFYHGSGRKSTNRKLLAVAPTYSNLVLNLQTANLLRQDDRMDLIMLPGARDEVRKISKLVKTDIFLDYKALESNFKEHASKYEILHLAMHTVLNDSDPLYSKMAFTQLADSLDDGFLHAYEIYNMQLNAKLAVLSSCSSGFGKLQEGEGMQSLARSFAYAGCPSVLMSLWEVADFSTARLMEYFYRNLSQGMSKSEALRLSKIHFIQEADQLKSNPFFWSSFIILGDSSPIYSKYNYASLFWALPFLLLSGFFYYRRRMQRKNYGWVYR